MSEFREKIMRGAVAAHNATVTVNPDAAYVIGSLAYAYAKACHDVGLPKKECHVGLRHAWAVVEHDKRESQS